MYTITQEQLNKLLAVLGEVPAKLSLDAILLIHQIVAQQVVKEEKE